MENWQAHKDARLQFFSYTDNLSGREQLLSLICYWAAPTLLGLKPATLLSLSGERQFLWQSFLETIQNDLSLSCFELSQNQRHTCLLFYSRELLKHCVMQEGNKALLERRGYPVLHTALCLEHLKNRCRDAFPHEIGCFLGIPHWDVQAFMDHQGRNYKLCGYWKAYSHLSYALETFRLYDHAHQAMIRWLMVGKTSWQDFLYNRERKCGTPRLISEGLKKGGNA